MALAIDLIVKAKGWDQQRTAEELTIAASDVSDLLRGKLARSAESDAVA
jgi:predicted XRE-type DNA-binding protein